MILKSIFVYPKFPDNLKPLFELSRNLWCVWDYDAINLFYRIDAQLFRQVEHNPLKFLDSLSKKKLDDLSKDRGFLHELDKVWKKFQAYLSHTTILRDECKCVHDLSSKDVIAYFSMEYGLHESVPIYAGGLGVLAGDYLKGASDLDLPVVGVGLLYKYGYFKQVIDSKGFQQEVLIPFENYLIPAKEVRIAENSQLTMKMQNEEIRVKLWEIDVGKIKLILLDTNIEGNSLAVRSIVDELYVSDREKRIQQEVLIGMGGIKALEFLGIRPALYHLNEGHSAFVIISRLCDLLRDKKMTFSQARAIIRTSTIFTTHTPVIAGNEHFKNELVKKYIQPRLKEASLSYDDVARFAYIGNDSDVFWMPAFAINFSKYINSVSVQHGVVSRKMWATLFPQRADIEIPIFPVTNGVHVSWISPPITDLFNRYLGPDYIHYGTERDIWNKILNIPDEELWEEHRRNKKGLINYIRRQFSGQTALSEFSNAKPHGTALSLNTDYLTIVFARRFAAYKRPNLLLRDKERFLKILTSPSRPVQIIFAGKAHPADQQSKLMIREVINFVRENQIEDRLIFLENYDINTARHLVWGADVWLNVPMRDLEASGTSGMKAAMNGALHFSTLEGWWEEGYNGKNGWAITAGRHYEKQELQDVADANQLYSMLENEISVMYYDRNKGDVPQRWVRMMKESLISVCHNFNINRMLCDYLKLCYLPAMRDSLELAENEYAMLKTVAQQEKDLLKYWDNVAIKSYSTNINEKERIVKGDIINIQCSVQLNQLSPDMVSVELFYMLENNTVYKIIPMLAADNPNEYKCSFEIEGYGLQNINIRLRPSNKTIQDLHPEMIKWAD